MAEAAVITFLVSPIIKEVLSRISSLIGGRIGKAVQVGDVKKVLVEIHDTLTDIESLLVFAEKAQESHPEIQERLRNLEVAVCDAEDLLDEYDHQKQVSNLITSFLKGFDVKEPKGIRDRLKQLRDALKSQVDYMSQCGHLNQTESLSETCQVSERVNDVEALEKSLADLRIQNRFSGICIVGMPGVGKSAVARSIYQRAMKVEPRYYDLVAWVQVSNSFKRVEILKEMLQFKDKNTGGLTNIYAVTQHLNAGLGNGTFLLILDDVRSKDVDECRTFISHLEEYFESTGKSSILITTSSKQAANKFGTIYGVPMGRHELERLSEKECWSILEKEVLKLQRIDSIPFGLTEMEQHEISEQCGGLALGASVIGRYLGKHFVKNEWLTVKCSKEWDSTRREGILSALKRTSYDRLPSPLKKGFAYFSVFPKGIEIDRDELVQLWLTAGFLGQNEDVGHEYVSQLVSCYLLEVVRMDECGNIKSCRMHDLVHDLAFLVSQHETYICSNQQTIEGASSIRHMRVMSGGNIGDILRTNGLNRLRSLFLEENVSLTKAVFSGRLRSLSVVAKSKEELQASICKLRYVKYLNMSRSSIEGIPEPVAKFYVLQTLKFKDCNALKGHSSNTLEKLKRLRHFCFNNEKFMPSRIGKSTSLQTLPLFVVGKEDGWRIEELGDLKQLKGELKICNLEKVSVEEAGKAGLEEKKKLIRLHYSWSDENIANNVAHQGVLKGLRPNSNLKSLTMENYKGINFASWMVKGNDSFCLHNLVHLELINCDIECGDYSSLGLLPKLEVLTLIAMPKAMLMISNSSYYSISNIASSSQGRGQSIISRFPALTKLIISDMSELEEWEVEEGASVFSGLKKLHIGNCPVLKSWRINGSPSLQLSELIIQSCPKLYAFPIVLKTELIDVNNCPNLKVFLSKNRNLFDRIKCDGRTLKC